MRRLTYILPIIGFIGLFNSCKEEVEMEPIVATEQILYVSGEILRLTGRVLSVGGDELSDHGFVISTSPEFEDTIRITLGPKSKPGRFYGDTERLDPEIDYYCKSYIVSEGQTVFGNVLEVQTLRPDIISFTPLTALPGTRAKVFGKNFSKDTRVFFGPNEATILNIQFESRLDVIIPPIPDTSVVSVRVTTKGRNFEYPEKFEYIFGVWRKKQEFINSIKIWGPVSMKVGDKYVYGLGRDLFGDNLSERALYELDLNTFSWQSVEFPDLGVAHPFSSDGFFGSGEWMIFPTEELFYTNTWYEYVPSMDGVTPGVIESRGVIPFRLFKARSFTVDRKLFVLGGRNDDRSQNMKIWEYDMDTEIWSQNNELIFHVDAEYPFFMHQGIAYFGDNSDRLWQYFPLQNQWLHITDIPFRASFAGVNFSGIAEVIGDKAYVGLFYRNTAMWEYNILENTWKEKVSFPGNFLDINSGTFAHDGQVYSIRFSNRSKNATMEIWEFDPEALR